MMTYFEAAQEIVEMYNDLAYMAAEYDETLENHSEAVVLAIEALLLKADHDKLEQMKQNYLSQMGYKAEPKSTVDQAIQSVGLFEPYSSIDSSNNWMKGR